MDNTRLQHIINYIRCVRSLHNYAEYLDVVSDYIEDLPDGLFIGGELTELIDVMSELSEYLASAKYICSSQFFIKNEVTGEKYYSQSQTIKDVMFSILAANNGYNISDYSVYFIDALLGEDTRLTEEQKWMVLDNDI